MLIVNKYFYSKEDLNNKIESIYKMVSSYNHENIAIAVCFENPFDIMCIINFAIKTDNSAILIHPDTSLDKAKEIAHDAGCSLLFYGNFDHLIEINDSFFSDTPGLIQFSSGTTTGKPKLIKRSWDHIQLEIRNYNRFLGDESCNKSIILIPAYHSYGLVSGIMSAIKRGVMPIIVTEKNPKFIASIINSNQDSIVYGVPFLFHLLQSLKSVNLKYNTIVSSGAPLTNRLYDDLKLNSNRVMIQYGTSETGAIALCKVPHCAAEIGYPLEHFTVSIENEMDGAGEIVIHFNNKKIYTSDIGCFLENRSLVLLGRKDDLINVGGQKVIPSEVEETISRMGNIKEVVVYKIKHQIMGDAVKAMVVLNDKSRNDTKAIKGWCIKKLPIYKVPSHIDIVEQLPRNAMGKINRKELN